MIGSKYDIFSFLGCFCNMGACQEQLGIDSFNVQRNFEMGRFCGHSTSLDTDVIDGRPTGAVRVSFGWLSTLDDCDAMVFFLKENFLNAVNPTAVAFSRTDELRGNQDK
jgi:molybdenum cofactor sulfurtransferase